MPMRMKSHKSVDAFIADYPKNIQKSLKTLRSVIKKSAPKAHEKISYGMAGYSLDGMLVYFNAYKTHIGFYPGSSGIRSFSKELSKYDTSKGTVRFSLEKPN